MVVGLATVAADSAPVPDPEHDEWAWWPSDVEQWPAEAGELLRMGRLLGAQAPATPTGQDTPVPPRPQ
jgi:8-oxo-dGTP diphosphatase